MSPNKRRREVLNLRLFLLDVQRDFTQSEIRALFFPRHHCNIPAGTGSSSARNIFLTFCWNSVLFRFDGNAMWVTQVTSCALNKRAPVESFSKAAQNQVCLTPPVQNVFLSANRSLLGAGAPSPARCLLSVTPYTLPPDCTITVLDNLTFNNGGGYAG